MWALERLSTNNTPQPSLPSSRAYSPIPRRSNLGPGRPSLYPRDSTLTLFSPSGSHASLPAAARLLPRTTSRAGPPPEVEDPVTALERVLSNALNNVEGSGKVENEIEKALTLNSDIDFGGFSLQEYVDHNISAHASEHVTPQYDQHSVEEYENEREKFEDLHKSVNGCDDVLQSVEKYLSSFQIDLASVAAEIETLQARSTTLNEKLENRKKVENLLGPTVERFIISPQLVKKITEGPIDEAWIQSLDELQRRTKFFEKANDFKDVKAAQDLKPLLENLSNIATERIRDHFASQIRALRSPNINAQILQQQRFLQYQPLYAFLAHKQPELAAEIMQAYSNTMRWYYESQFTRYYASLAKLKLFATDRHDVLGEDSSTAGKARGNTSLPRTDNFSLARRMDMLRSPAGTAMPSHAAEETKASHHIETPFLAFNLAMIDNASFEYSFLSSFFSTRSPFNKSAKPDLDHTTITRHFNIIFTPVINLASTLSKELITESYDALGVLLLIRLTQHFAFTLQRRKVPTLDTYINGTNMLLWPRFQSLLDANCASLKQLTKSLPSRASGPATAAGTLANFGGSNASSASNTAPHPVTQRFANFVRAIIDLSSDSGDDEPVSNSLGRVRADYEAFLTKLGASFPSGEKGRRERKRLLTNNYALILAVLGDARGRLADETRARFEELKEDVIA